MTAALLVASLLYRPCILSAVAWAESRGNWLAVAGTHRGPYQIAVRYSRIPWWALHIEPLARIEAQRMLTRWHQRAGGDWHGALRGWRYGTAGLRGKVGHQYAAAVLSRCEGEL